MDYRYGDYAPWHTCTLPMGHDGAHGQNADTPLTNAVADIQAASTRQSYSGSGSRPPQPDRTYGTQETRHAQLVRD